MKRWITMCSILGLLFATNAAADFQGPLESHNSVIPLDGSWTVIDEVIDLDGDHAGWFTGSWEWNSPTPVLFTVTDLYVVTDAFGIYDNAVLVLTTPDLPDAATNWTADPEVALADPLFSKGTILFGAGAHTITIFDYSIPIGYSDGTVAFKAVAVPVPGAILLGMLGFGWAGMKLRRTR